MPKRPDSLETLQISLELLKRIPKGRTITAPELREQLADAGYERDMRTIQRQLETLAEFYDLDRDDSTKPYRYCWKERAKGLSLPSLSTQESLLLMLAEQHLSSLLPAKLMKSMEGFFTQARSQLGGNGATQRERESHRIRSSQQCAVRQPVAGSGLQKRRRQANINSRHAAGLGPAGATHVPHLPF